MEDSIRLLSVDEDVDWKGQGNTRSGSKKRLGSTQGQWNRKRGNGHPSVECTEQKAKVDEHERRCVMIEQTEWDSSDGGKREGKRRTGVG